MYILIIWSALCTGADIDCELGDFTPVDTKDRVQCELGEAAFEKLAPDHRGVCYYTKKK